MSPLFLLTMFMPGPKHVLDKRWIEEQRVRDTYSFFLFFLCLSFIVWLFGRGLDFWLLGL